MRILHLDDHQLFTEGLKAVLERTWPDTRVHCCTRVEEALSILSADDNWDVLLADMHMPGLDGMAFLRSLAERGIMVPVLLMSALDDPFVVREAMALGALGFVPKHFSTDEIVAAIEHFVEQGLFVPDELATQLARLPAQAPDSALERARARYALSDRQMEVLTLMSEGYANRDIAQVLHVSENTVKTHVKVLFQSLAVSSRIECVREAQRAGLL